MFSAFVAKQLVARETRVSNAGNIGEAEAKMCYAILTTAALFAQHVRNSGNGQLWVTYTRFGGFSDGRQKFMATAIWECLQPHLDEVLNTVYAEFMEPGTSPSVTSVRPYLTDSKPNVFSVLHLVTQSIVDAYVKISAGTELTGSLDLVHRTWRKSSISLVGSSISTVLVK